MTAVGTFELIPITQIHESKHNPRQHFDGPALEQLADSIREVGIIDPLIVRPNAKGYELASGHRRYRAAKAIGLEKLPCVVRDMADQVFMEALTISNLQREDVHPLDEAKGYEALMAAPYKMDVHKIAERVGKSIKYIYDRVKLLALIKEARDCFWTGKLQAGHAILLARLTPTEQAKALGSPELDYQNGGVFEIEHTLYDPEVERDDQPIKARSVRELEAWIDEHVRFDRKNVDPMLFPETAAKLAARAEIPRAKVLPITFQYLLNDDARRDDERTYGSACWKRADGQDDSKTCDHAVLGCVVAGIHRGDSFDICVQKKKCRIHWKDEVAAAEAREKGQLTKATKTESTINKREQLREAAERRKEAAREQWRLATPAILKAVADRVKTMPVKATGYLADLILQGLNNYGGVLTKAQKHLSRGTKAEDLIRLAALMVLFKEIDHSWSAVETFPKRAKALGIDLAKLLNPKSPAKAPAKASEASKAVKAKRKKAA